jgi:beta-1,4-mannosyl-glycoprotein beta-1,4-N-acetylglucosaminyltransferase
MIYDCFTFFNELDLLELRLKTLGDIVDRFVLVESTRTFTNQPKPLNFELNKERFQAYLDRIIYVIVDDNPDGDDPWVREQFQRDAVVRGLNSVNPTIWSCCLTSMKSGILIAYPKSELPLVEVG